MRTHSAADIADARDVPAVSGVYMLVFASTGHFYIGYSANMRSRVAQHVAALKCRKHYNKRVQELFDRNGADDLRARALEAHPDMERNAVLEAYWIRKLSDQKPELALNKVLPAATPDGATVEEPIEARRRWRGGIVRAQDNHIYTGRPENVERNDEIADRLRRGASWSQIIRDMGASRATIAKVAARVRSAS